MVVNGISSKNGLNSTSSQQNFLLRDNIYLFIYFCIVLFFPHLLFAAFFYFFYFFKINLITNTPKFNNLKELEGN